MPELPEVQTIVSGLQKLIHKEIKNVSIYTPIIVNSKKPLDKLLINDEFSHISRHGKYIKLITIKQTKLLIHLRMTGQLIIQTQSEFKPDKHTHIRIDFVNGLQLIYRDIRKFGRWTLIPADKDFSDYINAGEDALSIQLSEFKKLLQKNPNKLIKAFLLDQTKIAGIGNIYVDEICFDLGVLPTSKLSQTNPQKLLNSIQKILTSAIKNNGTTFSDYLTSEGKLGNFQNLLCVYHQKSCPKCGKQIQKNKVSGRSTHYCAYCQK